MIKSWLISISQDLIMTYFIYNKMKSISIQASERQLSKVVAFLDALLNQWKKTGTFKGKFYKNMDKYSW